MRRILTSARERGLLANRSLHQIVMCVVFGVARVEVITEAPLEIPRPPSRELPPCS